MRPQKLAPAGNFLAKAGTPTQAAETAIRNGAMQKMTASIASSMPLVANKYKNVKTLSCCNVFPKVAGIIALSLSHVESELDLNAGLRLGASEAYPWDVPEEPSIVPLAVPC